MGYYDFKTSNEYTRPALYLGTLTSGGTMNVASKYSDYANLTADNFVIVPQSENVSASANNSTYIDAAGWTEYIFDTNTAAYSAPSITYNPQNGNLTFTSTISCGGNASNAGPGWGGNGTNPRGSKALSAKVYLLPEVETV